MPNNVQVLPINHEWGIVYFPNGEIAGNYVTGKHSVRHKLDPLHKALLDRLNEVTAAYTHITKAIS